MKLKRLICFILTVMLFGSMVPFASAANGFSDVSVAENNETGQVTISGKASGKATVTVMVLKQGKSMADVYQGLNNLNDVVLFSQSKQSSANGAFTVSFDMRYAYGTVVESGIYPVVLADGSSISSGVYSINHVNMEDVRLALARLNGATTAAGVESVIKADASTFALFAGLVEACSLLTSTEKTALYERFLAPNFEKTDGVKELFETFAPYSVLRSVKETDLFAQNLKKLNQFYQLKLNDGVFADIKGEENKAIVYNNMIAKGTFVNQKDTQEVFQVSAVLGYINDVIAPGTMLDTLKKHQETFGLTFAKFNGLSEKKQNKVLSQMVNTTITDSDRVKGIFDSVVSSVESEQEPGGGGGGGSSSGGKTTIHVTDPVTPPIPPVITEDGEVVDGGSVFYDLEPVGWAKNAILNLYAKGVVKGVQEGIFQPNNSVTRAEFIKMITLAFDLKMSEPKVSFTDVEQGSWYYQAVQIAASHGIITGNEAGAFAPDSAISREDIAVILTRTAQNNGIFLNHGAADFADESSISEYAKEAVGMMKESGIISGVGNGLFAPKAHATRAEAAKVIFEMLNQ